MSIQAMDERINELNKDCSKFRMLAEELASDKQRQRNEFIVLQTKAAKITSNLKHLAMHISNYLEENKSLRKQLDRCEKRQHLGIHDMTPRPDYREIFKRREFRHFKDDFLLKILRQELTSTEVVEQVIDVVKVLESKMHFESGNPQTPLRTSMAVRSPKQTKNSQKKAAKGTRPPPLETSAMPEERNDLLVKQKTMQQNDASYRLTESMTPLSGNLLSNVGISMLSPARRKQVAGQLRPRRPSSSESRSISLDSAASRLSDKDYATIREIERGMQDINKDFEKIVNI